MFKYACAVFQTHRLVVLVVVGYPYYDSSCLDEAQDSCIVYHLVSHETLNEK